MVNEPSVSESSRFLLYAVLNSKFTTDKHEKIYFEFTSIS